MPKHKLRKAGDNTRISKGKCASEINFDITEQFVDEENNLSSDEEFQAKTDEESTKVDRRTFDEIMMDAFEEFNSKSSRIRSNALTTICMLLQQSHNPAFLTTHIDRFLSVIENAMQSNNPCEMDAAASLISLATVQLLDSKISTKLFYKPLKALVKAALDNENLKSSVRSAVCRAMGILIFLYETDSYRIRVAMQDFQSIFMPNLYHEPEATKRTANYEFQVAACETWMFLVTLLPSRLQGTGSPTYSFRCIEQVFALLESPCYHLRVAFAKGLAVVFECGSDYEKIYLEPHLAKIIRKISSIVSVWNKTTSDIKSTPEVLQYLEKGKTPYKEIRNGKCLLKLDNWALNVQYEMLSNVLGSANVAKHLWKNEKLLKKMKIAHSTNSSTFSPGLEDTPAVDCLTNDHYRSISGPAQQNDDKKFLTNLEHATHKSPMERTKALEEICKELSYSPLTPLADQKNFILDIILKAMKRGGETEQLAAVRLATLTVLQLGREDRFCSEISNLFLNSLKHSSTSSTTSAAICTALAFFELVDNEHGLSFEPVMHLLRQKFTPNEQSNLLRIKALEAWGLLVTLCSPKNVCSLIKGKTIQELTEMLQTSNAEFRVVCGQVISLIVEQGRIHDKNYLKSDIPEICNVINDVINDRRNNNRDERKLQNTKLREMLKYLEDGCHSSFKLRFAEEVHELKTWSSLFKYQKLSQFIGQNLATHLQQNDRIRNIISIGPKPVAVPFQLKPNLQHKLSSAAMKKSKAKENRLNFRTPKFGYV